MNATPTPRIISSSTLTVLLGGRAAEELIFQQFTTGAGNDLERATDLARKMVCNWGMSEELGPVTFGKRDEHIFLGREISQSKDFSEETARLIDHAIKNLVLTASRQALDVLSSHRAQLEALAQGLLDKETLDSQDIDRIMASAETPPEAPEPQDPGQSLGMQQA